MSNHAARRRRHRPMPSAAVFGRAMEIAAEARGCECAPTLDLRHAFGKWVGVVNHDDACPALDQPGRAVSVYDKGKAQPHE